MTTAGISRRTAGARRADRLARREHSQRTAAARTLPHSVLMVDDCRHEGDRLEAMLHAMGPEPMRIDRCDSGLSAVEVLRRQRYDLVLISYRLPDMHGLELLSEIANMADDMAVILVGGRSGERVAADAIKSGAEDYLDRAELTPAVLREAIIAAMRTARLEWRTNCQIQQLRTARQEMQQRNVLAIAQKGAELYDKFAGFVGDMQKIGERLQQTQAVYDEAYKKLTHGRGNLIAQVEQLRKLGVQPKKTLPPALLEAAMEHEEIPVPKASGPSDSSPAVAAHPSFSVANAESYASAAAARMPAARSDESTTTVPFSSLPSAEMPTSASALRRKAGGWEHCEDGFGGSEVMGTEVR